MKITSLALLLLSPTIALAQTFEGIYGGANLGIAQSWVKLRHDFNISSANFFDNRPINLTNMSPMGGISLGYSWIINPYLIVALESRATYQNLQMNYDRHVQVFTPNTQGEFHARTKINQAYSFLGKVGWMLIPGVQIYGLIGPQLGIFKTHRTAIVDMFTATNGFEARIDNQKNRNPWGYVLGLGLESTIGCNSSLAIEYNFSIYGSLNVPQSSQAPFVGAIPASNITVYNSVKVLTNSTMLRYTYYFGCC